MSEIGQIALVSHHQRGAADSPRLLGQINDEIVLRLFSESGPLTRAQIGQETGLSKPTVSALLERLTGRNLVIEAGLVTGGPGPRARQFDINTRAAHVVGIHVERDGSVAALADLGGTVLARHHVPVSHRHGVDPRAEVRLAVAALLQAGDLKPEQLDHVVIATPGVIDPVTGTLRHARHLSGWEEPGLRDSLAEMLGVTVEFGNDVNLAALAEGARGCARGSDDYVLLWLGRGTGMGLVLGGTVRTGAHGGAGEIGYLPVHGLAALPRVDRGSAGAFQHLIGHQGIRALARSSGLPERGPAATVAAIVRDGDPALIEEVADRIAVGIAAITAVIDPEVVVLGGPTALAGGEPLRRRVEAHLPRHSFVRPPVKLSELDEEAIVTGAIELGLRTMRGRLFGNPMAPL